MNKPAEFKTVEESRVEMVQLVIPNESNIHGNVLGGRVMHWIDLAAATVAMRHCHKPVVTASVDEIDFHHPIKVGQLAVIKAHLTYTGRTSMEIKVSVFWEDLYADKRGLATTSFLTFVAIDKDGRPVEVPSLKPVTDEEKQEFEAAKERRAIRLERKK